MNIGRRRQTEGWPPPFLLFFLKGTGRWTHPLFLFFFRRWGGGYPLPSLRERRGELNLGRKRKREGWSLRFPLFSLEVMGRSSPSSIAKRERNNEILLRRKGKMEGWLPPFLLLSLKGTAEVQKERESDGHLHSYYSPFKIWGDDHLPLKEEEANNLS